jgi:cobalt-zinc-cadmium efflux system membrane fusion protein
MESSLDAARARYESARGLLLSAGISEGDLEQLRTGRAVSSKMLLRAPAAGALVERQASLGQLMEPGMSLAVISDPGALWIEARVGERDLWRIEAGQRAEFSSDGAALDKSVGEVIWVSQYLDKSTRSGIVRAQIEGSTWIRAGEYGRMTIHAGGDSKAALVPKDAVQWEGCCNVVFVREAADVYRPKKVRLARGDDSHYRVIDGLEGGEWLVVNGSYLLKTELKKSSIGAGCCGLDAES